MQVHLSNPTALVLASGYAVFSGILLPSLLALTFNVTGRSSLVQRLAALIACLVTAGLVLADFVINRSLIFMSDAAQHLYDGVGSAVVFSNIAASTWIATCPENRSHLRKPACLALSGLTAVALASLLPQAWRLLSS